MNRRAKIVRQYWKLTDPKGEVSTVAIEVSTSSALEFYELLKSIGMKIENIDFDTYHQLEQELVAA